MNTPYVIAVIAVCALCTFGERLLPFLVFRGGHIPKTVEYLGRVLPMAIMTALVFYCLKGVSFGTPADFLPELIAGGLTAGLHLWRKNTLLSILCGTVCYMVLVQVVFA